jgi:hypothetical protein
MRQAKTVWRKQSEIPLYVLTVPKILENNMNGLRILPFAAVWTEGAVCICNQNPSLSA